MDGQKHKSLFFPMLLIAVGVVLVLTNTGTLEGTSWSILAKYWPVILILGGLDGLYKRDGWVGPLVLLGFGAVLLLGNLGYLGRDGWQLLLRLWPILLVAWGLDLALGRNHSTWSVLGRVALGILLVVCVFWLTLASPITGSVKTMELSQKLEGTKSAVLDLALAAGEFHLGAGDQKDMLLTGQVSIPKSEEFEPTFSTSPSGSSQYKLESPGSLVPGWGNEMEPWGIAIHPEIPIFLSTHMGAGEMVLDLTGTHVNEVKSELGVGSLEVILPENQSIEGQLHAAIGQIVLRVPQCAAVKLHTGVALGDVELPAGYTKTDGIVQNSVSASCAKNVINLNLDLAIGSIEIEKIP